MLNLICPKCGRTSDNVRFIEAFCAECYPIRIETPDRITFEQCVRCDRIRFRGEWIPYNERKVTGYIVSKCKGDFETADYNFESQKAIFSVGGGSKIERGVIFELKKTICQQCSRVSGGYYEGIVQLRGNRAKIEKQAKMIIDRLEKVTFITKTEEKDGGLDLYVGNSKPMVKLMVDLGVKTTITKKLAGQDQGKRLYRTTYLIRFD